MKAFHSKEEAERYADKNYYRGTYQIEETKYGNWKIVHKQNEATIEILYRDLN